MILMSSGGWRVSRALAIGGVAALMAGALPALAQEQPAQGGAAGEPAVQTVIVTGSMIKRTDFDTPSPVQVVSSQDLQQSGYTSVSDVLRNISANGQGTLSQSFNQAFAGGGAGVALRGLTVGATLTLIDGERMLPYPLADDAQRNFVDVSSIPFLAVDRIDVLKDGASAQYGSDAIAGVINVVMKKSYTGMEFTADAGGAQHKGGTTGHLAGIAGIGDLAADGYNAYLTIEYRHQDAIYSWERTGVWNTRDWTPYGGYDNRQGAGTTNPTDAIFLPPLGGIIYNPAVGGLDPTSIFLGNCNYAAYIANQCTYYPPRYELQPQTVNLDILGRFTKNLAGDWQAVVTGSMFRSESEQFTGYSRLVNQFPYQNIAYSPTITTPTLVPPNGILFTIPATYPGNTFGAPTQIDIPPTEIGQQQTQFVTNTYRLFGDLRGTAAGWDLDASLGLMYARLTQKSFGFINGQELQNALDNGYVFGSANGASVYAPEAEVDDTDALQLVDLRGSRELATLPGGPLSMAIGVGYYHLSKNSPAPPTVADGEQFGNNAFAIGTESNSNAYVELDAPIVKGLDIDVAGRYDNFAGAGSDTTPSIKLRYTPFEMLTLRGTYGKGFRVPNPAEAGVTGAAFGGFTSTDPTLCPSGTGMTAGDFPSQCVLFPTGVQAPGHNLQPEKSTNYTFGFIFKPVAKTEISVDYWDIKINEDIQSGVSAFFLGADPALFPLVRGPDVVLPQCTATVAVGNCPTANVLTPVGPYAYQLFPYVNFTETHVNGVDVDLSTRLDLGGAGRLTGTINYTRLIHYIFGTQGSFVDLAGTHGPEIISGDTGNPKNRAVTTLAWDKGPVNVTLTWNYVGSFSILDPSIGISTCDIALNSNFNRFPGSPTGLGNWCNVDHFSDFDLYARYAFGDHFELHASILNLFDTAPPLDIQTYGAANAAAYNPAMHQAGAVGRFFNLGVTYTF
jgi:iron complex outermembrane recepter protein